MSRQAVTTPSFTYRDYRRWTGDERWEIIAGDAFAMSPAPQRVHQEVVGELFRQISNHLIESHSPCRAYVAPFDVRLPQGDEPDDEIDTVVQPDISVICDPRKLDRRGCRGAPDWIIEVLSTETATATTVRDPVLKRDLTVATGSASTGWSTRTTAS